MAHAGSRTLAGLVKLTKIVLRGNGMTSDELKARIRNIEYENRNKIKAAYTEYAMANNSVKIGDIITDHQYSLKVDSIRVTKSLMSDQSECIYQGYRLKKNGEMFKSREYTEIYQSNMKISQ